VITEIVLFSLPEGMTREQVVAAFRDSAPKWRANPDLIRKNYLYDAEKRWHGEEFRKLVRQRYGSDPVFQYFETPVVVDNVADKTVEGVGA
jgi:hypothetical protein